MKEVSIIIPSIIIPAYNEESRIEAVLTKYCDHFSNWEKIVVCDGTDSTPIVRKISKKQPNIKLLNFEKRLGKGGAIIKNFKAADGDKIGFVNADESVEPYDIKRMFDLLPEVDVMIASRRLKKSKILVSPHLKRRIASKIFNIILVRMIFGLDFRDTQCGAKVFKKEAIKDVLDKLNTKGFEFDVELLWKLKKKGYKIIEFPITWKHCDGSSFRLSYALKMFFSLIKARFNEQ